MGKSPSFSCIHACYMYTSWMDGCWCVARTKVCIISYLSCGEEEKEEWSRGRGDVTTPLRPNHHHHPPPHSTPSCIPFIITNHHTCIRSLMGMLCICTPSMIHASIFLHLLFGSLPSYITYLLSLPFFLPTLPINHTSTSHSLTDNIANRTKVNWR